LLITAAGNLSAQDFKGGVVKYQQIRKYDFATIFDAGGDAEPFVKEWIASLPTSSNHVKVLYFTEANALYEEDPAEKAVLNERLQVALEKANYVKPPGAELKKVYYNFGKNERTQQVMFMTRNFLVSGPITNKTWKLVNKRIKVLNYICMGAEMKKGDNTITAWFTPEIPVSAGPGEFFGLPGLILAVEINGEYAFLAASVDLTPPEESVFAQPVKGKKVTQEEFGKIMEDKIKEYKEILGNKRKKNIKKTNANIKK